MSVNGMRQVVEEVGSSTVDQSICLMADIKLAQFALLKFVCLFCGFVPYR